MKNILVIGGGAMGSAFTIPSLENKNNVTITEPYSKRFIKDLSSKKKFHSALKMKLPKQLRKASKLHAGQAKIIANYVKNNEKKKKRPKSRNRKKA